MIEKYVYAKLSASSALTALTSSIYAGRIEQEKEPPFVMFTRSSTQRKRSLLGANGMTNVSVMVSCFAPEYGTAKAMADAVRLALDGVKATAGGVKCQQCALNAEFDDFEDEPVLYRVTLIFSMWFTEALS